MQLVLPRVLDVIQTFIKIPRGPFGGGSNEGMMWAERTRISFPMRQSTT